MLLGRGSLDGRGPYVVEGHFTLTEDHNGQIQFVAGDDFSFSDAEGRGMPEPGFALFHGDPTGWPMAVVMPTAKATDFLRLPPNIAVNGRQSALLSPGLVLDAFDTVILICFRNQTVLGVGSILKSRWYGDDRTAFAQDSLTHHGQCAQSRRHPPGSPLGVL
ncbi:hypothetical protein [Hasllibacter sp. MH4015]|uniref:hypothetical protein n=1 Tax=Hasllibacter sp. MH4015 TaxID=2854029 RepID=UPI001CD46FE1|nr:hypothetical protein [Hasllibacter sp. MH4015]